MNFVEKPLPTEWLTIAVVFIFTVTYSIHFYVYRNERSASRFNARFGDTKGPIFHVLLSRGLMTVGAGIIPIAIVLFAFDENVADFGLRIVWSPKVALVAAGLSVVSCAISVFSGKDKELLVYYPQVRRTEWTPGTILFNSVSWAAYLFAYELMFRGFLLYLLLPAGAWVSIAINTLLYVAVHVPKGKSEAAGALVYGPVLCLLTLWSGTIWIAFFAHVALALGNSFSCLKAHPDMKFVGMRGK